MLFKALPPVDTEGCLSLQPATFALVLRIFSITKRSVVVTLNFFSLRDELYIGSSP